MRESGFVKVVSQGNRDYERYPTAFTVTGTKSTRALRREWDQKQGLGMGVATDGMVHREPPEKERHCGGAPLPGKGGDKRRGGPMVAGRQPSVRHRRAQGCGPSSKVVSKGRRLGARGCKESPEKIKMVVLFIKEINHVEMPGM